MYRLEEIGVNYKECPAFNPADYPEIKAITYDGMSIGTNKTKVFAYLGFPKHAKR